MGTNNEKHKLIFAQIKNAIQNNETGRLKELVTNNNIMGWTPLHFAIEYQNQPLTKLLLEEGNENVDALDNFDRTPLSIASYKNDLQLMKLLVENGANVKTGFQLHNAVEKGDCNCVNYLIELGVEVNEKNTRGHSPIIIAVKNNNLDATKILIDNGADVNITDQYENTPLHFSCDQSNYEITKLLIQSGATVDALDKYKRTPLQTTLLTPRHPEMTKLLLKSGAKADSPSEGYSYLHYVIGNLETVQELIKYGLKFDFINKQGYTVLYELVHNQNFDIAKIILPHTDPNDQRSWGGWVPLHVAVLHGNLDLVKELLKFKADVNLASACNVIPLHLAACKGFVEIAKLLLEEGSLVDVPVTFLYNYRLKLPDFFEELEFIEGDTPLSLATRMEHTEMCDLLKKTGAEVMKTDKKYDLIGWTSLHHSVATSSYDESTKLIEKGANINAQDKFERTPLSIAAFKNDSEMLKLLLNFGANVDLGYPLHYAVQTKSLESIQTLVSFNCNMNEWEYPPLILAAEKSYNQVVKSLVKNGAQVNCVNKLHNNQTPLIYSSMQKDYHSASILIKYGANVNAADSTKQTPFLAAADGLIKRNKDLLKLLIENNADITAQDSSLSTALYYASDILQTDDSSVALKLIELAPSLVNVKDILNETPLFSTENSSVAEKLVENGAEVNLATVGGYTILHNSCEGGNLNKMRVLLKNNANINAATSDNLLPIHIAAINGCAEEVDELLKRGSYVDAPMYDLNSPFENYWASVRYRHKICPGDTALICAARTGNVEVVKLLLDAGACVDDVNSEGDTALDVAVARNSVQVVRFLKGRSVNKDGKNDEEMEN